MAAGAHAIHAVTICTVRGRRIACTAMAGSASRRRRRSHPTSTSMTRHDPVPTRGGNALVIPMGAYDQRPVEERRDVLCYTSEPLTRGAGGHGPDRRQALCRVLGAGYRLHRQAGRRPPRWLCPESGRWHRPGALPRIPGPPESHHPGNGLRIYHRPVVHQPSVQTRPSPPRRHRQRQFPALRP